MTKAGGRRNLRGFVFYLSLVATILVTVYPIFNMVAEGFDADLASFFSGRGIRYIGGVPYYSGGFRPNLVNLVNALQIDAFPRLIVNSTVISLLSVAMALGAGIPAGYFLARTKARGENSIGFLVLALRTVLPFAIVIPLYLLFAQIGLWGTYPGVAIAYLAVDLPLVVLMVRSFFADVPKEIYEAAEVSGASERQIFRRIALPAVLLGIVATAIFAFVLCYNEFLIADILTGGATKTVTVGVWTGAGENVASFRTFQYDQSSMYGTIAFIPAFVIILTIKRYLARGFSLAVAD